MVKTPYANVIVKNTLLQKNINRTYRVTEYIFRSVIAA